MISVTRPRSDRNGGISCRSTYLTSPTPLANHAVIVSVPTATRLSLDRWICIVILASIRIASG